MRGCIFSMILFNLDRMCFHSKFIFQQLSNSNYRTYTNDTGFEEIEATIYSEPVMGTGDDASLSVATDYAMATDYLNDAQNENAELSRQSNELIVTYNPEDVQGQGSYEFVDNLENNSTMILSEYSGQLSTFQAPASYLPSTTQSVCGIATASADSGPDTTRDKEQFTRNSVNLSRNVRSPPGFARSTRVGVNASSSHKGPKLPLRTNAPTMSTSSSSKAPQATTTSSPTDRNMEAMQNKLSSCISALSTKVTEKQNRSPHAPFLAYLGTKLPNVPKEELAALEKEILNLVDSFCR